jgi:hypothetical protein
MGADVAQGSGAGAPNLGRLRWLAIGAGLICAVLFVAVGVGFRLQEYADGSIFSYAIAVRDAWAFHWHNISGRLFVYLFAFVPAEAYVALSDDASGGITLYGLLFFAAPLLGLALTYAADRSPGRLFFIYACASTAILCPLVFGFPTEMWMAHALFWPALAACHNPRAGIGRAASAFALVLALVMTHEGAVVFAVAILVTLALRGLRDATFLRGCATVIVALAIWASVKLTIPPDAYFGSIVARAAFNFIDVDNLVSGLSLLLAAALAGYAALFFVLRPWSPAKAHMASAAVVALALAVYWLWFDRALHADNRYPFRTFLLIGLPVLAAMASAYALAAEGGLRLPIPLLPQVMAGLTRDVIAQLTIGAVALVLLVHAVETVKFVTAWSGYKAAVRTLATGTASDPQLGDPRFVSSARIPADLNRLSWFSTTQYLSVLVAPGFAPTRLVVDPNNSYFWLSCALATASAQARVPVPVASRELIRLYSCQHRTS